MRKRIKEEREERNKDRGNIIKRERLFKEGKK